MIYNDNYKYIYMTGYVQVPGRGVSSAVCIDRDLLNDGLIDGLIKICCCYNFFMKTVGPVIACFSSVQLS